MTLERKNGKTATAMKLQAIESCKRLWDELQLSDGHTLDIQFGENTFCNRMALYRQFGEILLDGDCPEWEIRT